MRVAARHRIDVVAIGSACDDDVGAPERHDFRIGVRIGRAVEVRDIPGHSAEGRAASALERI